MASQSLYNTVRACELLPDSFNKACSMLFGGNAALLNSEDWSWMPVEERGWGLEGAKQIFMAGIAAYGTEEQYTSLRAVKDLSTMRVVGNEKMALEVTHVEEPDAEIKGFYEEGRLKNTFLTTLGRVVCRRLDLDLISPYTSPPYVNGSLTNGSSADASATRPGDESTLTFWIDTPALTTLTPGMKIEANVRTLDCKIGWLDSISAVHPSTYKPIPNETYEAHFDAVLPKDWHKRARTIARKGWVSQAEMNAAHAVDDGGLEGGEGEIMIDDGGGEKDEGWPGAGEGDEKGQEATAELDD